MNGFSINSLKSLVFQNKEVGDFTAVEGLLYYDRNHWDIGEPGNNFFVSVPGRHIGGL